MELGKKIYRLRKLSGMTQEQLAGKLNVSRQTLSKWENGSSMPDVESVVRISVLFRVSLDELLLEEDGRMEEMDSRDNQDARNTPNGPNVQITLEDLTRINARSRNMNLLLCSGLLFLAIGLLLAAFEKMLESTTLSLSYILYRYMVTGQYEAAPVNYGLLLIPAALAGAVGLCLCFCYLMKNRKNN